MQFLAQYGTSVKLSSTFGGSFDLLLSINSNLKKEAEKVKESIEQSNINANHVIFPKIVEHLNKNLTEWKKFVRENPSLLFSRTIPIYEFIEKTNSTRKESLKNAVKLVEDNAKLSKLLKALDLLNSNLNLAKFLRTVIRASLNNVCNNQEFISILETFVIKAQNLNFDQFAISCTHDRWYSTSEGKELVITREFRLIPGFCFTKEVPFSTCVFVEMKLPPGIQCINFFNEPKCNGELFARISTKENLAYALINSKSFAFC